MTHHLSTLQIKQLSVSGLPEDELVAAAVHTAECQSCHSRFVDELQHQRGSAPFHFTLEPEFWFRNEHVDIDQLVALVDKTLDYETEEIINLHLQTCETCREDVRSFLAFRDSTAGEMGISYGRPEYQVTHEIETGPWWQRLQRRSVLAVAAIVLVAVAVLIGVLALNKRSGSLEAGKHDQTTPASEQNPNVSSLPAPGVISSPGSADDSAKIAILKDAGGEVTIDKNGRVTGIEEVSENSRQYIARVALAERIEPAAVLRRLSGAQSGLRGDDNNSRQEFRLLYPVSRVVIEDRPVFRWESLPGVSSYRVYLLDANGKQVGESEDLPPTQTQWKPSALRRGQIFSWVVTAEVNRKTVVSPSASAPETKFAVLSAADFQELALLKKSDSHLALGVFYARAGLLNEAEREFENLIEFNPQSELPQKLLQSVRSIRKAD